MRTWERAVARVAQAALDVFVARRCAACDAPSTRAPSPFCDPCDALVRRSADAADRGVTTWFSYEGPVARAVTRAKYGPDEAIGRALAQALRAELAAAPARTFDVDIVTYVPAHWRRRMARRFDLPQLFASELARALGRPCRAVLRSTEHTAPRAQDGHVEVPVSRFAVVRPVMGQRLLLVDDVHTTGATLRAARAALEVHDAQVTCAAYALTPPPER